VKEGNGTMLDHSLIIYLSDAAEEHHGQGEQWPMILVGNLGGRLKTANRFLQYPGYKKAGHRTMSNFFLSLLHAVGDKREKFGEPDRELRDINTAGPLAEMSKLKLRRWGLTENQITSLVENKKIAERVTLYSPIQGTVIEKTIVQNSAFKAGDALYRVANLDKGHDAPGDKPRDLHHADVAVGRGLDDDQAAFVVFAGLVEGSVHERAGDVDGFHDTTGDRGAIDVNVEHGEERRNPGPRLRSHAELDGGHDLLDAGDLAVGGGDDQTRP